MTITNNIIQRINQRGFDIALQVDDTMGVVIKDNIIREPEGTVGQAIFAQTGNDDEDTGTLCMDITGNIIGGIWDTGTVGAGGRNMRLRQAPNEGGVTPGVDSPPVFRVVGLVGSTAADVDAFLNANNTNALAESSAFPGTSFTGGPGACF